MHVGTIPPRFSLFSLSHQGPARKPEVYKVVQGNVMIGLENLLICVYDDCL